jgi:transcription elongation GreA/GreB family factor
MSKKIIVSRPSLQTLAEKLEKHTREKQTAQREAKVAKEWGDLSENAEYKASKEKFRLAGRLQQRVTRELKHMESQGYEVVDPLDWAASKQTPTCVEVGVVARVTQKGFTEDYLLAGAKDNYLPTDVRLVPVPYTSPLGKALMGQVAPSKIEAEIAGERRTLIIESLRVPTMDEILELFPELTPQD